MENVPWRAFGRRKKEVESLSRRGRVKRLGRPPFIGSEHGDKKPMLNVWMDHVGDETFNLVAEPKAVDFKQMTFPVLTATGFFDDDQPGALRYYRRYMADAPATAADNAYLVIGPWDHGGTQHPAKEILGLNIPEAAVIDMNKLRADWYDWVLGRGPRPGFLGDKVTYFMLGADERRSATRLKVSSPT